MSERHTILLVEDNPDDVELTVHALRKIALPFEVMIARDGAEALDYIFCTGTHTDRDRSIFPSLVLLDINMPKVSGVDVLRRIRANATIRFLPVIMLTSSSLPKDIATCYNSGANGYVQKPVNFTQFSEAIALICRFWLAFNILPRFPPRVEEPHPGRDDTEPDAL